MPNPPASNEPRRRTATMSPRQVMEANKDPSELSKAIASQLANLQYECANCLELIQAAHPTWHCLSCFRVFHLKCIKKWAQQEESGEGRSFRCPHCQAPQKPVTRYRCFCLKMVDPPYDPMLSCPHTCGNTCGRRRGEGCPHPCGNQCHPGPCPDCSAMAPSKRCPCQRTAYTYRCGKPDPLTTCDGICGKKRNCGVHTCDRRCHHDPCPPCTVQVTALCACGRSTKEQLCGSGGGVRTNGEGAGGFHCDQVCDKLQQCAIHHCNVVCHSGPCPPCDRDPSIVATCPCGKEQLVNARSSCEDAIPSCGKVCGRALSCGRHYCEQLCHDSPCPPCEHKSQVHCPCRSSVAKMYCRDADSFRCSKKCKTKMTCGKHECDSICCKARNAMDAPEHRCTRPCGKKLPCGHFCTELCHRGPCPACPNIVVAPLTCRCGVELLMPPLPCGTPPPACRLPCLLPRPCGHPAGDHACHHGDCPPCTNPVTRLCAGGHKMLTNVLCSAEHACCSEPCGRALDCGHVCQRPCHPGSCIETATTTSKAAAATKRAGCSQPCGKALPCGHSCSQRCHVSSSSSASSASLCGRCHETVELRCDCGLRCEKLPCAQYLKRLEEHRQSSAADKPFSLPCNDDCLFEQRLSILRARAAPKPEGFGKVIYSLKLWAVGEKSPELVTAVEERLLEFVKSKELSLMLPAMQKEKRAVVHELCQYFHIHSESQDQEPNRTVFLTKTVRTNTPNPLLTQALRRAEQQHPAAYVESVLKRPEEAQKRIVVVEGEGLNALEAARALSFFAGDFVLYEPKDTELLESRRRPARRTGCAEDLTPMTTYYAVFLPHRAKVAYEQLRQRGSSVLYHLLGFSWPPKQFAWEPTRPDWSNGSGVGASLQNRGLVSAPSASSASSSPPPAVPAHEDPASAEFAVQRRGKEKPATGTWASLVQQSGGSSAAEKAKKRQEAERRVEVTNRFSALGGK